MNSMGLKLGKDYVKPALSSRVIAVTSGKGGVGKTNITVNLAIALAEMGKRVIIFDADLGMSNAEILMGIVPKYTIYDFLYRQKSLKQILTMAHDNVGVISGGSGLVEMANLDSDTIKYLRELVQNLELEADAIMVDTGAGLSKNVLAFTAAAQEVVTVVTPDPTSIVDAYGVIKVLSNYGVHKEINIIVNRCVDIKEAKITFEKLDVTVQRFLPNVNINYLGYVPEDSSVVRAIRAQVPFIINEYDSPASKAVKSIASQMLYKGQKSDTYSGIGTFFKKFTAFFNSSS